MQGVKNEVVIDKEWLDEAVKTIAAVKKGVRKQEILATLTTNLAANNNEAEAVRTVCNAEAKLYEKTMAALTLEERLEKPFSAMYFAATSRSVLCTAPLQELYGATVHLIALKKSYAEELRKIVDVK